MDDLGQIGSVTDELGHTTGYAYDTVGRLTQITYPTDTLVWNPRNIAYAWVASAERGIAANHWRRTETEGNGRTVTYYDARLQPILTDTDDSADSTTHVSARTDYDWAGRTIFHSWPKTGSLALGNLTTGTHTTYDVLGRATGTAQDSELGTLTTSIQYQAGTKREVTDPKGHVVTTTYQAFDQPVYDDPIQIVFAGGPTNTVERDGYGKPLSMTQSGTYNGATLSVTHNFGYDAYHRLCVQISPETGRTGYGYDDADNLYWTEHGLAGSSTDCPSSPLYRRRTARDLPVVWRTYDARDRLRTVTYEDDTPGATYTYTDDGKVHTATRGNAVWTYAYYNRGLPKTETLAIDGHSFTLTHGYDASGHENSLTYPSGLTVSYAPDGLGRPTQAGTYAYGASYAPNGQLSSLSYGNGVQASWQFNARQLPSQTAYSRAGVALSSRTLNYDANANLVSIADPVLRPNCFGSGNAACWTRPDADNTDGNRSFTYDALDRLTEVVNPYVADQFTYDPLGNLRTSSELGSFTYDASNRVQSRIHGTVFTYTWDARGNLTSDGERSFSWNLANELVGDSHGTTYAYDARGWRVKEQASGESPVYSLYDRTHQLVTRWSAAQGETDFVRLAGTTVARVSGG